MIYINHHLQYSKLQTNVVRKFKRKNKEVWNSCRDKAKLPKTLERKFISKNIVCCFAYYLTHVKGMIKDCH